MLDKNYQTSKIFVGGLDLKTNSNTLKSYFNKFGDLHYANIMVNKSNSKIFN